MVPPMEYMPVGVLRSPSTLLSLKPLPPMRAAMAPNAGCQPVAVRLNASSVAALVLKPSECTTMTCRVAAGSFVNRVAALLGAAVVREAAGALADGAIDGSIDGSDGSEGA